MKIFLTSLFTAMLLALPAAAQTLQTIYSFNNSNGPAQPQGRLVQGADGNFYGTTTAGGTSGKGTVFKMTPNGVLTTLVNFNDANGADLTAGVVQGRDGNFYGLTMRGGSSSNGTAFKMTPNGVLTTLHNFSSIGSDFINADGAFPLGGLVQGTDGNFYGATPAAGSGLNGTAFMVTPNGGFTTLANFDYNSGLFGYGAQAGLMLGTDGNFYGTYQLAQTTSTVFQMTPNGALTTLASLDSVGADGYEPLGELVQGTDGNFYGTMASGGRGGGGTGYGTVFKVTPNVGFTILVRFNSINGAQPRAGLIQGRDGNLYGTTEFGGSQGGGTVFKVTTNGVLTTLVSFNYGAYPLAGLVQAADGSFYGTTKFGGSGGGGTIFKLSVGNAVTDLTPPTLTITAPVANQRWSNSTFTVTGQARDNVAVADVQVSTDRVNWNHAQQLILGWTNWNATINNLTPGANTVYAYAIDTSGNHSPTNKVSFNYVLSAVLTVNTNGRGTISPNYNNASLPIGSTNTMTATPATGFGFANWTDGNNNILTTNRALKFVAAPNLVLNANFVDITRPIVTIVMPTLNQKWSNANIVVTGKASDNVAVADVQLSQDGVNWTDLGNATNWSSVISLTPGPNMVFAYAIDTSGNYSLTNKVSFTYIVSAVLTVNTNGRGTISPNYNNALLQLGTTNTMTATPAIGSGFANWTDGNNNLLTTNRALKFVMAPNLVFIANFVDIAKPTLSITNIPSGGQVSNEFFVVIGKASDNFGVANVFYRLTNSLADTGWQLANPNNNFNNWSAGLDLNPGTNVIAAYAVDAAGNVSATNTVKFKYIVSDILTVSTNGKGSILPAYNGAYLQISNNYTMTATPGAGFKFTGWTDGSASLVTTNPALHFLMMSNLSFAANFIDISKPTLIVTTPTAATSTTSEFFLARGTAADNAAVASVQYQLNNSGIWTDANLLTNRTLIAGSTNWSVTLDLTPGTNYLATYAVDTSGNSSATNTVKFLYTTAPTSLNGMIATIAPNGGTAFAAAFGATTFSQQSADTSNANGVGNYTYTRTLPDSGTLKLTYTAPPQATNGGPQTVTMNFSAPGVAQFSSGGNAGGIVFTSTPTLVPASILNRSVVHVDELGVGRVTTYTAGKFATTNLLTGAGVAGTVYSYAVYGPVGALVKRSGSLGTTYVVETFQGTNYGLNYSESYTPAGSLTNVNMGTFGLVSQHPGGNAPTNLVNRTALLTSDGSSYNLAFPDAVNFNQLNPADGSLTTSGTYTYSRTGANIGSLNLTYPAPPDFSSALQFVAPNFFWFTNSDGTVGTAVVK